MTPAEIAQEVEVELSDSLAELAMISRMVSGSPDWSSAPPSHPGAPVRIWLAERWLGGWSLAEWRQRLDGYDSSGIRRLTRQWVVSVFSRWEEVDRKQIVAAGDSGNCDLFGDLRNLRNDIVHHDAVATRHNSGKCKLLTRFEVGDPIFLSPEDFVTIMEELSAWVVRLGGTPQGRVHRDPEGRHK